MTLMDNTDDTNQLEHKNVVVEQFFGKKLAMEIVRESLVQYQVRYTGKQTFAAEVKGSLK